MKQSDKELLVGKFRMGDMVLRFVGQVSKRYNKNGYKHTKEIGARAL